MIYTKQSVKEISTYMDWEDILLNMEMTDDVKEYVEFKIREKKFIFELSSIDSISTIDECKRIETSTPIDEILKNFKLTDEVQNYLLDKK